MDEVEVAARKLVGAPVNPCPDRPSILIVIPCLNEAAALPGVVARVLQDGLQDLRLVVVDGGSTDGSVEIVQTLAGHDRRVRLLRNPKRLQSAGVNLAARECGDGVTWMVRVDAHAGYPADYVSTLVDEAGRTGAASVVVAMETHGEAWFQRAVAAAQNSRLGTGGSAHRGAGREGWVDHGHHALFRIAEFLAVGGYDETFSHNEDAELDIRLGRAGGKIWLTNRAPIRYYPRATAEALARQYFRYGKGRARTVLKHRTRLKVRQALPLAVAPALVLGLAAPVFWPLGIPAVVWLSGVLGYGLASGAARRDPAVMMAGVAAAIMHSAWSAGFWAELVSRLLRPRPKIASVRAAA